MNKRDYYEMFLYYINILETTNGEEDPVEYTDTWRMFKQIEEELTETEVNVLREIYYAGFIDNQAIIDA